MTDRNIYRQVATLAAQGICLTRSEFTKEINPQLLIRDHLPLEDGYRVRELIEDCYREAINEGDRALAGKIAGLVVTNDGWESIYDPSNVYARAEDEQPIENFSANILKQETQLALASEVGEQVRQLLPTFTAKIEKSLLSAQELINKEGGLLSQLASSISATAKISKQTDKLEGLQQKYGNMIMAYQDHVYSVRMHIKEYESARHQLKAEWLKLLERLEEMLGPSLRASEPELFDLRKIEEMFVDSNAMLSNVNAQCDKILQEASLYMSASQQQRSEHLAKVIDTAEGQLTASFKSFAKHGNSKRMKREIGSVAIQAGADMLLNQLNRLADASEQAAAIKVEIEKLRVKMLSDSEELLSSMQKTKWVSVDLSEKYIPITTQSVLQMTGFIKQYIQPAVQNIYSNDDIALLKIEKSKLKKRRHELLLELNDMETTQIPNLERGKALYSEALEEVRPSYEEHMNGKPAKPGLFGMISTLGIVIYFHGITMKAWERDGTFVVPDYEFCYNNLESTKQQLEAAQQTLDKMKEEVREIEVQLEDFTKQLYQLIRVTPEAQQFRELLAPSIDMLQKSKKVLTQSIC